MGDMVNTWGADWLGEVMRKHVSQLVEIRRGTLRAQVQASLSEKEWETIDAGGVLVVAESRDFVIQVNDYTFGSGRVEPQHGDEIRWHMNGTTYVFRVVPFGDEGKCFRYRNRNRTRFSVHSEEVKTE